MSFTTYGGQFIGTELMVRELLASRLYLTKEELEGRDIPDMPKIEKITWLAGMDIRIVLTPDLSVQSRVQVPKFKRIESIAKPSHLLRQEKPKLRASQGMAFTVVIQLRKIRDKKDKNSFLDMDVTLVNNNGALTKWHLSDACNWFKRAMPESKYGASVIVSDGEQISKPWSKKRRDTVARAFFLKSVAGMNSKAAELKGRALEMDAYNLQRAAMYRFWADNLLSASRFYDEVRTAA